MIQLITFKNGKQSILEAPKELIITVNPGQVESIEELDISSEQAKQAVGMLKTHKAKFDKVKKKLILTKKLKG